MMPPGVIARFDQRRAGIEHDLIDNVATFRAEAAQRGDTEALADAMRTIAGKPPRAVASMLAVAIARLARES